MKLWSSLLELEPSFLPLMCMWRIGCHYSWTFEFNCFGENYVDINIWVILEDNKQTFTIKRMHTSLPDIL